MRAPRARCSPSAMGQIQSSIQSIIECNACGERKEAAQALAADTKEKNGVERRLSKSPTKIQYGPAPSAFGSSLSRDRFGNKTDETPMTPPKKRLSRPDPDNFSMI